MLARLFRFSTELSARRSLRGGLVSAIRPLAFLSAAACVSSVQADEIDVWRQAFLSRWIGATTNGEWQLPPAIGAALAPKLETTESSETAEAPSSRRKIRQTSAMVGETAPLRLMPRDVQAQYLEDADPSLVWEPQRPPYPKVVRSRHVERTEPALAHDPARVRAAIRANPEAMPLPEDPRILRTSDEVIVETTTPAQPTATITASPAEPPQKCVAPSDDEPQNDAAAAIADIMEKLGGALEGSEFAGDMPFGLESEHRADHESDRRATLERLRRLDEESKRGTANPDAIPTREPGQTERTAELIRPAQTSGVNKTAAYGSGGLIGVAGANERIAPEPAPVDGEPNRLHLDTIPAPAAELADGIANPRQAADALWEAAAQLEQAANVLEKESLYERADQIREQAHRLRIDARNMKHPRTAVRPAGDHSEQHAPKTSSLTLPAAGRDSQSILPPSASRYLANYEDYQFRNAPRPREPLFLQMSFSSEEFSTPTVDVNNVLSIAKSNERLSRLLDETVNRPDDTMLIVADETNVELAHQTILDQMRKWERATYGSVVDGRTWWWLEVERTKFSENKSFRPQPHVATLLDILDRMGSLLEGTAYETRQVRLAGDDMRDAPWWTVSRPN